VLDILPAPVRNASPLTFEDLHQDMVLYCIVRRCGGTSAGIEVKGLRDYAIVMVNGRRVGILDRRLSRIV